jgi:hypothetical protein
VRNKLLTGNAMLGGDDLLCYLPQKAPLVLTTCEHDGMPRPHHPQQ